MSIIMFLWNMKLTYCNAVGNVCEAHLFIVLLAYVLPYFFKNSNIRIFRNLQEESTYHLGERSSVQRQNTSASNSDSGFCNAKTRQLNILSWQRTLQATFVLPSTFVYKNWNGRAQSLASLDVPDVASCFDCTEVDCFDGEPISESRALRKPIARAKA